MARSKKTETEEEVQPEQEEAVPTTQVPEPNEEGFSVAPE